MQLSANDLSHLADLASTAAREAGALIANYQQSELVVRYKAEGDSLASQVVTEVDELSQAIVLKHLEPSLAAYDLALLTEERADDGSRLTKDYFWCIDPLDGTLPFTRGIPGYSVSIALVARDGRPMLGVIFDPVEDLLYRAVAGQGAWRDDQPWHPLPPAADWHPLPLYLFCDCTFECHPQRGSILQKMQALSQQLGFAELKVKMGGGGVLNACWALEHAAACYFKQPKLESGGGSFWDFAATACLFHEVGAVATDFQGDDLELNRVDSTFMNHRGVLYATHPQLAVSIREYFA